MRLTAHFTGYHAFRGNQLRLSNLPRHGISPHRESRRQPSDMAQNHFISSTTCGIIIFYLPSLTNSPMHLPVCTIHKFTCLFSCNWCGTCRMDTQQSWETLFSYPSNPRCNRFFSTCFVFGLSTEIQAFAFETQNFVASVEQSILFATISSLLF